MIGFYLSASIDRANPDSGTWGLEIVGLELGSGDLDLKLGVGD